MELLQGKDLWEEVLQEVVMVQEGNILEEGEEEEGEDDIRGVAEGGDGILEVEEQDRSVNEVKNVFFCFFHLCLLNCQLPHLSQNCSLNLSLKTLKKKTV